MSILCIYCAGGLGRDFLSLLKVTGISEWKEQIFIDDVIKEKSINGVKVLTFQEFLKEDYRREDCSFFILNGEPEYREQLYQKIHKYKFLMGIISFNTSIVAHDSIVKAGSVIQCHSIISSGAIIGNNVFVGKKAMVGHDVEIGNHSVISACSYIGGWVRIGNKCFVGAGASIRDQVTIGNNCIIGMGSVVTKDVPDMVIAGNPARVLRINDTHQVFGKDKMYEDR